MDEWKDQIARLDIAEVAQRLGLQVASGRRSPKVALCPFHDDTTPSLRLFEGESPHYHCFSCHAHGDTVELVKQRLGLEFIPALEWLAANFSLTLDRKAARRPASRPDINRRALEFWRAQDDGVALKAYADARRLDVSQLRDAGLVVGSVGDFLATLRGDRAAEDEAISTGLAHPGGAGTDAALRSTTLSPFAQGAQLIIPLATLRVRSDRSDIAERIPAVRYWSDRSDLVVTGAGGPSSPVSFAYQVDMRALEERPDRNRRRDMFRPFLECWNSFILHIGRRIDRMQEGLIHIARLDVKGFYDHVPRHAIEAILRESLPDVETLDAIGIAPLFGADLADGDRREALIEWILQHSFGSLEKGYTYACPGQGVAISGMGGSKGLPQGPALSAYLANIVLFGLDAELERRVSLLDENAQVEGGAKARGGLYARYVDDIIIAARTPEDLRALRSVT